MGKQLDITGERFGNLVAVCATDSRAALDRGGVVWKFKCDCGNEEVYKVATDVKKESKRGQIFHCGCKNTDKKTRKKATSKPVTLLPIGTKIGKLTIREVKENKGYYRGITYTCECDCGTFVDKLHYRLKSGKCNSCGCLHSKSAIENSKKAIKITDITGQKYGYITAIRCLENTMKVTAKWEVKCFCGNVFTIKANDFLRGRANSCGCINSLQEDAIRKLLDKYNINYKQQYLFKDLLGMGGGCLRFDFGVLNNQDELLCLIEYDGYYHFHRNNLTYKGVNVHDITKEHDKRKNEYCKNKDIKLYRLNDPNNIEENLLEVLKDIKVI